MKFYIFKANAYHPVSAIDANFCNYTKFGVVELTFVL